MARLFSSSNPVLNNEDAFREFYGSPEVARPTTATLQGIVNRTGLLVLIAVIAGAAGYQLLAMMPSLVWISSIAAFVIALGFGFMITGKPQLAKIAGPIYAIVEGIFLGSFTALADRIVEGQGLVVMGGVGVQAFVITASAFAATLGLYKAGILKATPGFKKFIYIATGGIMVAYIVSFALSFAGISVPLISFGAAVSEQGLMGFLGLGINLLILAVASLMLVMDFDRVEKIVGAGVSRDYEWFAAFGLLVTLAWIYFEAVKLVVRLAVLFGNRD